MVGVSASVNLPLHHKVQKFSPATGSPGWSLKKGRQTVYILPQHLLTQQHNCDVYKDVLVELGLGGSAAGQ